MKQLTIIFLSFCSLLGVLFAFTYLTPLLRTAVRDWIIPNLPTQVDSGVAIFFGVLVIGIVTRLAYTKWYV